MIIASHPQHQISRLLVKHQSAIEAKQSWLEIWELFYNDLWFCERLEKCARFTAHRYHLSPECKDDIQQEALVLFSRSLERDVTLGFNPDRGRYGALVATIIHRSCQKSVRQFRLRNIPSVTPELFMPLTGHIQQHEDELDLLASIERIPEPYKSTIRLVCSGLSIEEIAEIRNKSKRTIYRWLDRGTEQLRDLLTDDE